jgi:hypothetical protein
LACIAAVFASLFGVVGDAAAMRVKVRGGTRIAARATRGRALAVDGGTPQRFLLVDGTVEDDVGNRLSSERVELRAAGTEGRKVRFDDGPSATTCDAAGTPLAREGDAVVASTDGAGRFCARLVLPIDRYTVTLATSGGQLLDAAAAELGVDLGRRSVSIRFDGVPKRFSLDRDEHTVVGVASFDDEDIRVAAELLPLTLVSPTGTIVGTEVTGIGGQAIFHVPSRALGEPGLGDLRLTFPGDEETAAASTTLTIEKRAKVALSLERPIEPTSAPEDGVRLGVVLSSRTNTLPSGVVEARMDDTVVGAAPVRDGRSEFSVAFSMPERAEANLAVRFLPEAPWWEAPDALAVRIPLTGLPVWRKLPLLGAGLLVAAFLVLGRLGRVRSVPRAPKSPRAAAPVREGIAVLEVARDASSGWSGRIVDAHDQSAVEGARVAIEAADFRGTAVLASAFATTAGEFTLPPVKTAGRAELVVDAPLHTSLRKALPRAGVLEIALVSRKRAILDRLVEWARLRGKPYDVRPEPTPAHVRKASSIGSPPAKWAEAVESAAFGPDPVDGRIEAEVEALRPDAAPAPAAPALPVGQTRERT